MTIDQLMKDFAARQQIDELEQSNNRYTLSIDHTMEASCFQANGRFFIYGSLLELPKDGQKREELLKMLLERNLVLMASERVSLCIDSDISVLALCSSTPMSGLSLGVLEDHFEEFSNNFELFKRLIGGGQQLPPAKGIMLMP